MNIVYEMLPIDQWKAMQSLYTDLFPQAIFPGPEVSSAAVARDGDKIVAFWFLQLCAHAEPVGIMPGYEDIVSLHQLQQTLFDGFKAASGMEFYIAAPNSAIAQMLENNGYKTVGILYANKIP